MECRGRVSRLKLWVLVQSASESLEAPLEEE